MKPQLDAPRWWLWPTVLSLDAPLVVLAWQRVIASAAHAPLHAAHAWVLGSSVWLAYAADRWIEGWRLDPGSVATHRHRFYQRWRWQVFAIWMAVLAGDLAASFEALSRRELLAGTLLLLAVAAYLLSHQLVHRDNPWRLPKEMCVALLLAAGCGLFPGAAPGADLRSMIPSLGVFACLCFCNCTLISIWEHDVDAVHGQTSLSHQFGRKAAVASHTLPWLLLVVFASAWVFDTHRHAYSLGAMSALLLGLVDRFEPKLGRMPSRVLADIALLTPFVLVLLPWLKL